jgi:hypothetical protein
MNIFFTPALIVTMANLFTRVVLISVAENAYAGDCLISTVELLYIVCWFLMKKYTKTWAPFVIIPYTFAICVATVLIFNDVIPVSSKETHAYNLIFCLQNVNFINSCSFLINVLVWAPMLIISYSMQLIAT